MFGRSGRAVISGTKKGAGKRKRAAGQDDGDAASAASAANPGSGRSLWKKNKKKLALKVKVAAAAGDKPHGEIGETRGPKAGEAAAFEAGRSVAGGSSVKAKLKRFRAWAAERGCYIHPAVTMAQVAPDRGNGLVVAAGGPPIAVGARIIAIPEDLALEARTSAFWPTIQKLLPGTALAQELGVEVSPHDAMILSVAHEIKLGARSRWQPYLELLPLGPGQLSTPLLWHHDAIAPLDNTLLHSRYAAEWDDINTNWEANIGPIVARYGAVLALSSPVQYAQIGSVIRAYAFTSKFGSDVVRLLPVVDLMNHDCVAPTARVLLDDDESGASRDGEIGVVSVGPIAAGAEVLFSYGQLSNHELLWRYGFMSSVNPSDAAPVSVTQAWRAARACLVKAYALNPGEISRRKAVLREMNLLDESNGPEWVSVSGPLPVRLQMLFRVAAMTEKTMANPDIVGLEAAAATLPEEDSADEAELDELHMRQFLAMYPAKKPKMEAKFAATLARVLTKQLTAASAKLGSASGTWDQQQQVGQLIDGQVAALARFIPADKKTAQNAAAAATAAADASASHEQHERFVGEAAAVVATKNPKKKKRKKTEEREAGAKPKVVAFDFDKCLMTQHWWGTYRTLPLSQINPGPADFAHRKLDKLLRRLLKMPGVHVAVASFGRGDVIRKAIDSILPPALSKQIFITTPGDYTQFSDGMSMGNKNVQLQQVSEYFDTPLRDIIFFDDDKNNIRCAVDVGINARWSAPFCEDHDHLIEEHLQQEPVSF